MTGTRRHIRPRRLLLILSAAGTSLVLVAAPATAEPSCTGQLISTIAPSGTLGGVVSGNATNPEVNVGRDIVSPEATAPHDECPAS